MQLWEYSKVGEGMVVRIVVVIYYWEWWRYE